VFEEILKRLWKLEQENAQLRSENAELRAENNRLRELLEPVQNLKADVSPL
jgi:cell division protein FtsB